MSDEWRQKNRHIDDLIKVADAQKHLRERGKYVVGDVVGFLATTALDDIAVIPAMVVAVHDDARIDVKIEIDDSPVVRFANFEELQVDVEGYGRYIIPLYDMTGEQNYRIFGSIEPTRIEKLPGDDPEVLRAVEDRLARLVPPTPEQKKPEQTEQEGGLSGA